MQFEIGKTYTTGESRDYVWRFTVISRTKKFITVVGDFHNSNESKRIGVREVRGVECATPLGSYSMCPYIFADAVIA